jgi:hypothetical protein
MATLSVCSVDRRWAPWHLSRVRTCRNEFGAWRLLRDTKPVCDGRQPAPRMRQNTKFRRLGRDAWIDTLSPRDPILPAIRGAFVLTDVTVVHADRPDEEHVDVLVFQANIKRITPTGTADLPPGATVFERARGSFVSGALPGPEIHYASASRTPRQRARRTRSCMTIRRKHLASSSGCSSSARHRSSPPRTSICRGSPSRAAH